MMIVPLTTISWSALRGSSRSWLPSPSTSPSGAAGIPADARAKPGSGGQLIAFVPSLDLVISRQTGGSGDWQFEEFLRLACGAALDAPAGADQ